LRILALLWALSAAAAASPPCPHPLFPMRDGLELGYRAGSRALVARFSEGRSDAAGQSSKLSVELGDSRRTGSTEASCTAEGIATRSGGLGVLALESSGLEVEVKESSGVLLPSPEAVRKGRPWTSRVSVELSPPKDARLPLGLRPVIRTTFVSEASYSGEEDVSVQAGRFHAVKVKSRTTAIAGATGSERSVESYLWFAEGVGLVKVMTGDRVDLELVSVKQPPQRREKARAAAPRRTRASP